VGSNQRGKVKEESVLSAPPGQRFRGPSRHLGKYARGYTSKAQGKNFARKKRKKPQSEGGGNPAARHGTEVGVKRGTEEINGQTCTREKKKKGFLKEKLRRADGIKGGGRDPTP